MKKSEIIKQFNKCIIAHNKLVGSISSLERELSKYIEFEFSVFSQSSDGWVLLNTETAQNAILNNCIDVILAKGKLSYEDFNENTI